MAIESGDKGKTAFYYDDGEGHAVKICRWLPWGHPERAAVIA